MSEGSFHVYGQSSETRLHFKKIIWKLKLLLAGGFCLFETGAAVAEQIWLELTEAKTTNGPAASCEKYLTFGEGFEVVKTISQKWTNFGFLQLQILEKWQIDVYT